MKMIFLGPPGAGKGTYASRLTPILETPHISTGNIVRDEIKAQTELGKTIREYSDKGELVPDEIIIKLLAKTLRKPDYERGFILDGFPRTIKQAEALDKISKIDLVINLNVPDEIIIKRLSNRLTCEKCGTIYNKLTLKPKKDNICDECGGQLYQREDDKPEVIQERLNVYKKKTEPLIEYYRKKDLLKNVHCNDLMTPPEVIVEKIKLMINSVKNTSRS
ncbi:MAG: adenylate kinase [Candidatus Bathyarchaeota archaeon]|nr:adenylate kinase [Candidatus Bathyarchaeota archaeon]